MNWELKEFQIYYSEKTVPVESVGNTVKVKLEASMAESQTLNSNPKLPPKWYFTYLKKWEKKDFHAPSRLEFGKWDISNHL